MIKNNDISCIFNSDAELLLSQNYKGDILAETADDLEHDRLVFPFSFLPPIINQHHKNIYPFFERLLNHDEDRYDNLWEQRIVPKRKECIISTLQNEECITLSFLFDRESSLWGIHSGNKKDLFPYTHPTVWINPPQDDITNNAKAAILSLSKN